MRSLHALHPPARCCSILRLGFIVIGLLVPGSAPAQNFMDFGLGMKEKLEDTVTGEVARGNKVTLKAEVAFLFQAGLDKYLSFKNPGIVASQMVKKPAITSPYGLSAKVVSVTGFTSRIEMMTFAGGRIGRGTGEGFHIPCTVEITALDRAIPGTYTVTVALPEVSRIAKLNNAFSPLNPPRYTFRVKVWNSEKERLEAKAAEERARREKAAAEERARQERLAAEERTRKEQERLRRLEADKRAAYWRQQAETERKAREKEAAELRREFYLNTAIGFGIVVGVLALLVAIARRRWLALRPRLDLKDEKLEALEKPGLITSALDRDSWSEAFQAVLGKAAKSLGGVADAAASEALGALKAAAAEPGLAVVSREVVVWAVENGGLHSTLAKVGSTLVYVVAFPGRHEHSELYRRYEPFTDGWVEHITRLRARLADEEKTPALLCLLFFLSPQARDGTLLVAYEGEGKRVVPGELVPEDEDAIGASRLADRYDFKGKRPELVEVVPIGTFRLADRYDFRLR